ncbi:MAG: DUF423 domain-containing protein [Rhodospirillales bacterium]
MSAAGGQRDILCAAASLSAAAAVGLGAYGAHGLGEEPSLVDIWQTGVAYQMWHALGAFACAWVASRKTGRNSLLARFCGWLLITGSLAFAVSLYVFVIDGIVPIQGLAPTGGMIMMAGWALLAVAAFRRE